MNVMLNTASTQTFCDSCNHPMHWRECEAAFIANGHLMPCSCRNDVAYAEMPLVRPFPLTLGPSSEPRVSWWRRLWRAVRRGG